MTFSASENPALSRLVTEGVDRLAVLAHRLVSVSDDNGQLLEEYREQLQVICNNTEQGAYPGLLDLMAVLDQGIDRLIGRGDGLLEGEARFLGEFPGILMDYLAIPTSKIAGSILVRHFRDSDWIRPLELDEYESLMDCVLNHRQRRKAEPEDVVEEVLDLDSLQVADDVASVDSSRVQQPVEAVMDIDQMMSIAEAGAFDEVPGEDAVRDEEQAGHQAEDISLADDTLIPDSPIDEAAPEESSGAADVVSLHGDTDEVVVDLDQFMQQPDEPDAILDDNPEMIPEAPEPVAASAAQSTGDLDETQQELVSLVKAELDDVIEASSELIRLEGAELASRLNDLAEEAENIGNAVKLMGLEGLFRTCMVIVVNLQHLALDVDSVTAEGWQHVSQWPNRLLASLQDIFNPDCAESLAIYLQHDAWPKPLQADQAEKLREQLANPTFVEDDRESRQVTAQPEDMSLDLPDDVNQELLDGLLQDLPTQTENLSSALQDLNERDNLEDLEVAQRIAHTLKGAANVVGVKGIANLTHHLEDILELQVKAGKKPVAPLMDVLIAAADCLEAMSEALLGMDAPPEDAVNVLQSVLDWANRIDQAGVPDDIEQVVPESRPADSSKAASDPDPAPQLVPAAAREASAVENMLRVPAVLADELLRLAGENLISTGQVQEQIRNIIKTQDAIQLHNQSLQQLSFDLEHLIDIQGVARQFNVEAASDFDPLEMDQYNEVHSVSRRLVEIAADAIELTTGLDSQLTQLNNLVIDQSQLQKESQELVLRTRMVPVKTVLPRLKRGVRQACRLTAKQVELEFIDNDTYMDSEVLNELIEPLMHVLRNAVDHGIEAADERERRGKPDVGNIRITFVRMGDQVVIRVEDDGRGLDIEKIRQTAMTHGSLAADAEMSEEAIYRLILENGFSTRDSVTQVSGRGIGLDVVNVKVRELKGSINIHSEPGNGCRLEMVMPISSFSTHSLLIRLREHVYAISNRGVEEILYPGLGELCDIGDEVVFQLDDQAYGALSIDDLLNVEGDRRQDDRNERPILLVREESGAKTAILVQEVIDSRDVVVKPLGPYLPRLDGIIGATVLGDGSVAPVLDLPEVLEHRKERRSTASGNARRQPMKVNELPYVLVVDDSLSARRSLAQFVEDLGLDVRTARDGMEAVSLIEARQPDLMLVDMEMPRMNGLELTSHVRASVETNKVPVIMITSRSTDKHRAAAMEKGVNHFVVKPFAEEELARYINSALDIAS